MIIHQLKPRIYQEVEGVRQEIPGGYVLKNTDQVGVHVAAYDATRPLVIDPVLTYSTYLGGSGPGSSESGNAIAVGTDGSAYVTGTTNSTDFPIQAVLPTSPTTFKGTRDALDALSRG